MSKVFRWFSAIAVILSLSSGAEAQWRQITYHLFNPADVGAMTYKDGILWIGCDRIYMSADTGRTWTSSPLPDPAMNGIVYDLQFFNRDTGLAAFPGGTYITYDQGRTWTMFKFGIPYGAAFGSDTKTIATAEDQPFGFNITADGGNNWTHYQPASTATKIMQMKDGRFIGYAGTPSQPKFLSRPHGGHLFVTQDLGNSWTERTGNNPDFGCWDFDLDSCDESLVYLANINEESGTDSLSCIYISRDSGNSWGINDYHLTPYFSGSLAVSANAVYAQTRGNGILRSTDQGRTWISIGGPNNEAFTRMVTAIDDNLLIAVNDFGSVYRTDNSGGDSVRDLRGGYIFSPKGPIVFDTVSSCDSASARSVELVRSCAARAISAITIVGPDSLNFLLQDAAGFDTLHLLYTSSIKPRASATLVIHLDDGRTDSLAMTGFGKPDVPITVSTRDVASDTIGATLYVPVIIKGNRINSDLSFAIHYDTSILVYRGTYATNGTEGSINRTLGNVSIHFAAGDLNWSDTLIAYIAFDIFPRGTICGRVVMDSFAIQSNNLLCQQSPDSTVAMVCGEAGCAGQTLSDFLRYGELPKLTITPNPSNSHFSLYSDRDLGQVQLDIRNELGLVVLSRHITLQAHAPIEVDTHGLASGTYTVSVSRNGLRATLEMVHLR